MLKVLSEYGQDFYPVTTTDAVGHNQGKCSLTDMLDEYNVTTIWPKESAYSLTTAIEVLSENLTAEQKKPGVKVRFTNSGGTFEEWEYFAGRYEFNDTLGWRQTDSSILIELAAAVFPLSVTLNLSSTLLQTGTENKVTLSWKVSRKGKDVTADSLKYLDLVPVSTLNTVISVNEPVRTTKTYTFTGSYQGLSTSVSKNLEVVDPSFYGIVPTGWNPTVTGLSSRLQGGRSLTLDGINLNNQKLAYAYPKYFGALTGIKDINNFEYLGSYTRTELSIGGVGYYVYTLTNPITITGLKQIFT